ncbi:MFS transporter [Sphingomonas sp. XXL09]|uniref:MFS transporter n=1 Tax=Sphingomonas sp. XXL09 TaxID=3457787 RepID=UPI00406BC80E
MKCRSYLVAHFCKSVLWHASGLLFAFFLTETCALPPRSMGTVIAGSLFVNAASDVTIGWRIGAHMQTPAIVMRRQGAAAGPVGLFFLLFCATPFLPVSIRLGAALVTLVGFRIAFSRMDVPQNALVPLLAPDPASRMRLLAARNVCGGSASLLVAAIAAPLLLAQKGSALPHAAWAAIVAWAAVVSARHLATARGIAAPATPEAPYPGRRAALPGAFVLSIACAATAGSTMFRAMEPYAAAYGGAGIGIMIWASLGAILCQPFWAVAGHRLSPHMPPLLAGGCALVAAFAIAGPLRAGGVGVAVAGLGFGIASGGLWLMVWDAAIRGNDQSANLQRIVSLTAVSKTTQGLAMLWLGHALHGAPYRTVLATPGMLRSLTMVAALLLITLGGLLLALGERRLSRTSRDAEPMTPPLTARTVQDQAQPRSAGSMVPAPRAATAG